MLNTDKLRALYEYKMVTLEAKDIMIIKELNIGYALKCIGVNTYYLEYQAWLYKTEEELIQDISFLCSILEGSAKEFLEFVFEAKAYQFKILYNKGLKNFVNLVMERKSGYNL